MKKKIEKIRSAKDYYAQKRLYLETFYDTLEQLSSRRFEKDKTKNKLSKEKKEWLRKELTRIVVDKDVCCLKVSEESYRRKFYVFIDLRV